MSAAGPKDPKARKEPRSKTTSASGAQSEPRGKKPRAAKTPSKPKKAAPIDHDTEVDAELASEESPETVVAEVAGAVAPDADASGEVVPEVLPPEPDLEASEADAEAESEDGEDDDNAPVDRTALLAPPTGSRLPVPVGRDLSHADALQRYLAEISRHPLLTREQEHDLAVSETHDVFHRIGR